MTAAQVKKVIEYWLKTAEHDWQFVQRAFARKEYSHALFFGHLVLEKMFKALVAARTKEHAKPTHNLIDLAKKAAVGLTAEMRRDFAEINTFNISTRYPEEKLEIYKKTKKKDFADNFFQLISKYYLWLKREIKREMRS